jgi:hypothetical protein
VLSADLAAVQVEDEEDGVHRRAKFVLEDDLAIVVLDFCQ